MTDFGADHSFMAATAKLKEHYGIAVPASAVRDITEDHGATMLAVAQRKAPHLPWYEGDIATIALTMPEAPARRRLFDAIVLAGNVMIFLALGSEAAAVANLARHLAPGGALVAGFQLLPDGLTLAYYDACAAQVGLVLAERWATWERQPWSPGSDYAVSVHRRRT